MADLEQSLRESHPPVRPRAPQLAVLRYRGWCPRLGYLYSLVQTTKAGGIGPPALKISLRPTRYPFMHRPSLPQRRYFRRRQAIVAQYLFCVLDEGFVVPFDFAQAMQIVHDQAMRLFKAFFLYITKKAQLMQFRSVAKIKSGHRFSSPHARSTTQHSPPSPCQRFLPRLYEINMDAKVRAAGASGTALRCTRQMSAAGIFSRTGSAANDFSKPPSWTTKAGPRKR